MTVGETGQNKYGGNLNYANGPFAANIAYQSVDFSSAPGNLGAAFPAPARLLVGTSYDFQLVRLFAQYQKLKNDLSTGDVNRNGGQVG